MKQWADWEARGAHASSFRFVWRSACSFLNDRRSQPIVPPFAFMTFQGALSNTFHQVAEVFHRPLHLILALLVSAALIPIAAYAMGSLFFGSNPNLVCGIVLEYSVPVAVTAFMHHMFGGNGRSRSPSS
ncbi:MAG: hypothetical protein ACLTXI_09935 [Collinsella sp.]